MESKKMLKAAKELKEAAGGLTFALPAACVYNPLDYAWDPHKNFIEKYGQGKKRVLFLGMNPGPWGMAQTGIPFGEVAAVRDWLKISGRINQPPSVHPKRPVQGFECPKSEVSGRRFWGLMKDRFGGPEVFFKDHWVLNYCPLVFMLESGANHTPDKLPAGEQRELYRICDEHLAKVIAAVEPEFLIGVGKFAGDRFLSLKKNGVLAGLKKEPVTDWIIHPSPANPAANRDWAGAVTDKLSNLGAWS